MNVIRILAGMDASRAKPDHAILLVHELDIAYDPLALRDGILHCRSAQVVQIQMVPSRSLRHPDRFVAVFRVMREMLACIVDERRALLVDHGRGLTVVGSDGDDAQYLMATLVVKKRESLRVRVPPHFVNAPGIGKQRVRDRDRLTRGHIEQAGLGQRDLIARLQIVVGIQFWLQLVFGRGLNQVNASVAASFRLQSYELGGIG